MTIPAAHDRLDVRRTRIRSCTLLLVDDESSNLDLLEATLEADGYTRLVRTTDAREVMELVALHDPDLVLLDLHMPYRSGLEVLQDLALSRMAAYTVRYWYSRRM